jgi:hypothetical protein
MISALLNGLVRRWCRHRKAMIVRRTGRLCLECPTCAWQSCGIALRNS